MRLRRAYAPVMPELDSFLFASVGEEVNGVPLSVLSALTRLGFDPRDEAARLSESDQGSGGRLVGTDDCPLVRQAMDRGREAEDRERARRTAAYGNSRWRGRSGGERCRSRDGFPGAGLLDLSRDSGSGVNMR